VISEQIRAIWERELALPDIADNDDFFLIGGHSLIMQKIQAAIIDDIGVEIPMDELFRRPTIAEISAHIEKSMAVN
jgi:acyl carrier protein